MYKFRRIIILLIIALLAPTLFSCGLINRSYEETGSKIIETLQKEVPFTIVVPTYFPKDIKPYPGEVSGPDTISPANSIEFGLTYYGEGNDKFIRIMELNHESKPEPSSSNSSFLSINGISVLEEDAELPIPSKSNTPTGTTVIKGILYDWNQKGINFQVYIFGYGKDESRKIIESMIN